MGQDLIVIIIKLITRLYTVMIRSRYCMMGVLGKGTLSVSLPAIKELNVALVSHHKTMWSFLSFTSH